MRYASLCTMVRNEAPYMREWIEFHRLVGIEHFFVYDNLSTDDLEEVLQPYRHEGVATLIPWPHRLAQAPAYTHCLRTFGATTRWVAFVDADEFVFAPGGGDLREALQEFEPYGGLAFNYASFGTSGHREKPEGPVIEEYVLRARDDAALPYPPTLKAPHLDPSRIENYRPVNTHVSSFVQPARTVRCLSPHYCEYVEGACAVDENHLPVAAAFTRGVSMRRIRANHYWSKSEEECRRKLSRGLADRPGHQAWGDFLRAESAYNGQFDVEIQVHLDSLRERLGLPPLEREPETVEREAFERLRAATARREREAGAAETTEPVLGDRRSRAVLVLAEEIFAVPQLLEGCLTALEAQSDTTLVVYARETEEAAIQSAYAAALAAGADRETAPHVLLLSLPDEAAETQLAREVDGLVSLYDAPGVFAGVRRLGLDDLRRLRPAA